MKLTRVVCPVCGGAVEVDEEFETAKCPYCKGSFVVECFKRSHSKKDKEEAVYQTRTIDVQGKRMARMKELLAYASKQMEIKFGHGFDVQLN